MTIAAYYEEKTKSPFEVLLRNLGPASSVYNTILGKFLSNNLFDNFVRTFCYAHLRINGVDLDRVLWFFFYRLFSSKHFTNPLYVVSGENNVKSSLSLFLESFSNKSFESVFHFRNFLGTYCRVTDLQWRLYFTRYQAPGTFVQADKYTCPLIVLLIRCTICWELCRKLSRFIIFQYCDIFFCVSHLFWLRSNAGFKKVAEIVRFFAKLESFNCKYLFITQDYSGKHLRVDRNWKKVSFEIRGCFQIDLDKKISRNQNY